MRFTHNHKASSSVDSKNVNTTFRTTMHSTPKHKLTDFTPQTTITQAQEKKLELFRHIFKSQRQHHTRPQSPTLEYEQPQQTIQFDQYQFPNWLKNRQDFKMLRKNKYFDIKLKVLSICEIDLFKRTEEQKEIVAQYLKKLAFFRLMPLEMLRQLGGRIVAKSYDQHQYICHKGELGNCMYVIYDGSVMFTEKQQILNSGSMFGRNALDHECPRNGTLKCLLPTQIMILHSIDYQTILTNVMKNQHIQQEQFIRQLPLFNHFSDEKIRKFSEALHGKFLAPNDNLFTTGDIVDNLYIVQQGLLVKVVVMNLEDHNRWPMAHKKWMSKSITRTINMEIQYKTKSFIGILDVVESEFDSEKRRVESVDAKEDCYLLYISKSQFYQIFSQGDIGYFSNYHTTNNPASFDHLVKTFRSKETNQKKRVESFSNAMYSHLTQYAFNYNLLSVKAKKFDKIIDNKRKEEDNLKQQYQVVRRDQHYKILTSHYE